MSRRPVLLLDEPTNHLDFETVEALGTALKEYKGTVLFISHDRTFVNLVATSVVEVKGGRVVLYPGDYESYVFRVEQEVAAEAEATQAAGRRSKDGKKKNDYTRNKQLRSRRSKLKKQIRESEAALKAYEVEKAQLHAHFLEHPTEYSPEKTVRSEELVRLLAETEEAWLAYQAELEKLDGE